MDIEFDPAKREATLTHRGVDFARCDEVFGGVHWTTTDDRKDYGETRFVTIGYLDGRMVVVAWTERGDARRIISMRKANDREKETYEPRLDRP